MNLSHISIIMIVKTPQSIPLVYNEYPYKVVLFMNWTAHCHLNTCTSLATVVFHSGSTGIGKHRQHRLEAQAQAAKLTRAGRYVDVYARVRAMTRRRPALKLDTLTRHPHIILFFLPIILFLYSQSFAHYSHTLPYYSWNSINIFTLQW